ncbi:hypothetical protein ACM720_01800 [Neisseria sp. LNP16475]|uniref:hypothetical protein n=1 Tax=Neisseria mucosa TaxID=488 RepID=UPI00163DBCFE|nr:hypothetical protein [Neisseria mucosa]
MNLCKGRLKSKSWFQTTCSYKQITPNTPPPSFPRRLESIVNSKKLMFENSCRDSKVDSRLRGNDGSWTEIYAATCSLPPLPFGGRGLGRGWLCGLHEFDFPSSRKAPHPSLPPPDGGRNKIAAMEKGRLKPKSCFRRPLFIPPQNL